MEEAHVVLSILHETLPFLAISEDGRKGSLLTAKDLRKVVYKAVIEYDPGLELWTLKNAARIRYKINARIEQYLQQLGTPLGELGVTLYMSPPCHIGVAMQYPRDLFGEDALQVDIAQQLYDELVSSTKLLGTITRIAHLCARLPNRGGTRQYQTLLPSRLAALTVCGIGGSYH